MRKSTRAAILACAVAAGLLLTGMPRACTAGPTCGSLFRILAASDSLETLIRRLMEQSRDVEFVGIQETTVFHPRRQSSRQKVTQKDGRRKVVYLSPPALRGKQIYVDGSRMLFDGAPSIAPDIGLGGDLARLPMKRLGTDQIAGRTAKVIEVRPPGRSCGSRKVWIDEQKCVPLCWENRDAQGTLISRTVYTSIDFDNSIPRIVPPAAFADPAPPLPVPMTLGEAEKLAGFRVHSPGYLPKGYHRQAVTVGTIGKGKRTAHSINLMFSNGLDLVTLSQAPASVIGSHPGSGKPRVSTFGQWFWVKGDYHYTLSATPPLPRDEMQKISGSIE